MGKRTKCDMVVDVQWEGDGECAEPETRWIIPHDAYNDDDGVCADLNTVLCDFLSAETGCTVVDWTFIKEMLAS